MLYRDPESTQSSNPSTPEEIEEFWADLGSQI